MRDKDSERLAAKVASELTKVRKAKGVSHEELSKASGISRASISYIENHKRNPTLVSCLKLAKALGVNLDDIIKASRNKT